MRPKLEGVLMTISIATLIFLITNLVLSIAIYRNQLSITDIENAIKSNQLGIADVESAINNTIFIENYEENN